jgi:hypothetical protein
MSEKYFFDFHPSKLTILKKNSDSSVTIANENRIDSKQPFHNEELIEVSKPFSSLETQQYFRWFSTQFTLIPNALFLPSQLENYYRLNFGELNPSECLSYDSIYDENLSLVYSIPNWLNDFKRNYFFKAEIQHHAACLIKNSFKSKNDDLISIVFEGTAFIMSIKKEGKLIICNSFEYQNEEDLIYFILSHHKQLGLIEKNTINLMSYLEVLNSEKIISLITHFKELKEYTVIFLDKPAYNSTLTCE